MKSNDIFSKGFFFITLFTCCLTAAFAEQKSIILNIEEPQSGGVHTGVSNIRGYALAHAGIARIELYVDAQFISNIPFGGLRSDVGSIFPDYPNANESGFSMAYNYSNLQAGEHTLIVKAVDRNNVVLEKNTTFNVTRFEFDTAGNFLGNSSHVDLDGASTTFSGNELLIHKLLAGGKIYDVQLQWRTPSQDFDITKITLTDASPIPPNVAGTWVAKTSLAAQSCLNDASKIPVELVYSFVLNQENNILRGVLNSKDANLVGLGLSGGVLAGGNYVLASRAILHDLSANASGCYSVQTIRVLGDFSIGSVQVVTNYFFGQPCPPESVSTCQLVYRGTTARN